MSTQKQLAFWAVLIPLFLLPSFYLKAPAFLGVEPDSDEAQAQNKQEARKEVFSVWITAYSSTPDQTDSSPFVTAARTKVRDGVAAANFLPFGTIVKIPEVFGDKLFVIEDRMHQRKSWVVDIWMPTRDDAIQFGSRFADIEVVKRP